MTKLYITTCDMQAHLNGLLEILIYITLKTNKIHLIRLISKKKATGLSRGKDSA